MKRFLLCAIACLLIYVTYSQAPVTYTSSDMYLGIRKLNVLGTVLYVAAHPDDENTRLLTYFSKDRMFRTGYLSMTRGDGGQNLIGEEQGIELGMIRTQELLSARRIDGGEQFFTRAYDFGYSKNPQETFTKWDKEKILSDVVWVIRKFQPDVIITRFPTTGEGGHGHHTASAILAVEAFTAAADANRFPEQLRYVKPWQAKKIFWNSFNFGGTNTTSNEQFRFDVGAYNPLLGKSYGEIAAESRSQHKSQGFGVARGRGEAIEFFTPLAGSKPDKDLFENVETSWSRVPGGESISKKIDEIAKNFDLLHPENSVKGLVDLYNSMKTLPDGYWKTQKMKEVQQLVEQCSGLWIDAFTQEAYAVRTDSIRFSFQFNNRMGSNVSLKRVSVDGFDTSLSVALVKNRNLGFQKTFYVPPTKPITQPYWLEEKMADGYFNVKDQQLIGEPDVHPSYLVQVTLDIEGEQFKFTRPVKYKFTDPVRGELYQPLVVIPALLVTPDEELKITIGNNDFNGSLGFTSRKRNINANIARSFQPDNSKVKASFNPGKLFFNERNQTFNVAYEVKAAGDRYYEFGALDEESGLGYRETMHEIRYDHIPSIHYFTSVEIENKSVDLKLGDQKRIGYITGAGDKVPEALERMGYDVTLLQDKELSRNNLRQFDAIITGVRAYNTNEWMNKHYEKLMKYVEEGGNLIVQYNTSNQIGPVRAKIGPYPFNITRTRITDENAPVVFLKPDHAVLNFPNKITQDDFKGWIQERSIYHGTDSSGKFEKIFSMNDPGERGEDGSLLIAKYGKGYFTYTGLVFFRQLPAGKPGAYRLLANLIALNRKKAF